jgi:predicted XRE-type DNA-binding protein
MEKTVFCFDEIQSNYFFKKHLAKYITGVIKEKGWNQEEAAQFLKLKQPDISSIVNGKVYGFSLKRLFALLNKLGYRVSIDIKELNETL